MVATAVVLPHTRLRTEGAGACGGASTGVMASGAETTAAWLRTRIKEGAAQILVTS